MRDPIAAQTPHAIQHNEPSRIFHDATMLPSMGSRVGQSVRMRRIPAPHLVPRIADEFRIPVRNPDTRNPDTHQPSAPSNSGHPLTKRPAREARSKLSGSNFRKLSQGIRTIGAMTFRPRDSASRYYRARSGRPNARALANTGHCVASSRVSLRTLRGHIDASCSASPTPLSQR